MKLHVFPVMIFVGLLFLGVKSYDMAIGFEKSETPNADIAAMLSDIETAAGAQESAETTEDAQTEPEPIPESGYTESAMLYSGEEIELLQRLSERRSELDARERDMDVREKLLVATENGIDKKIESLKKIEAQIRALVEAHDEQERAQIESLVKTYSAMKPKDAAKIFDTLDREILITIIEKMKPKAVANVLSKMQTNSANEITVELATRKKLPNIEG